MAAASSRYSVALKSTVHRGLQEFEDADDDTAAEEARKTPKASKRVNADHVVLQLTAARVLQHCERDRAAAAAASPTTNSASGARSRFARQLVVAASKRNAIDIEAVAAVCAEFGELLEDPNHPDSFELGDVRVKLPQPRYTQEEHDAHDTQALAVVLARHPSGNLVDTEASGAAAAAAAAKMTNLPTGASARSGKPRAAYASEGGGNDRGLLMKMATSAGFNINRELANYSRSVTAGMMHGMSTVSSRNPNRGFLTKVRRGLTRLSSRMDGRWPGVDPRLPSFFSDFEEGEETSDDEHPKKRRRPKRVAGGAMRSGADRPPNWREQLLDTYPENGMPTSRLTPRFRLTRNDFRSDKQKMAMSADKGASDEPESQGTADRVRVCPTTTVSPALPRDLDKNLTSVMTDGVTIRFPSHTWAPSVQMWEPFVIAAALSLHFFVDYVGNEGEEDVVTKDPSPERLGWHERHMEKLLKFTKKQIKQTFPCPLLQEHLRHPYIRNGESRFFKFLAVYLGRKFEPFTFEAGSLADYIRMSLFEAVSSPDGRTPRVFITSPWVIEFLRNEAGSVFEGQYEDLLSAARSVGLAVQDVVTTVQAKASELTAQVWSAVIEQRELPEVDLDLAHKYIDPDLVQRRYGGYSLAYDAPETSHVDAMLLRLVGSTLEDIVTGKSIEAVLKLEKLRQHTSKNMTRIERLREKRRAAAKLLEQRSNCFEEFFSETEKEEKTGGALDEEAEKARREEEAIEREEEWVDLLAHCVNPDDSRFMPFGLSLVEAFVLMQGIVIAMDRRPDGDGDGEVDVGEGHHRVLRTNLVSGGKDRHALVAALLIDLYMREKVDLWAWQVDSSLSVSGPSAAKESCIFDDAAAVKDDGPVSHVYRAFSPEDAVLWTVEAPPAWDAEGRGERHWLECYIGVAEDMFQQMEVPAFVGDDAIWGDLLDRGMLELTYESVDMFRVAEKRFLRLLASKSLCLWRIAKCLGRLVCCSRRARASQDACELFEFAPPETPAWLADGPICRYVEKLEQHRDDVERERQAPSPQVAVPATAAAPVERRRRKRSRRKRAEQRSEASGSSSSRSGAAEADGADVAGGGGLGTLASITEDSGSQAESSPFSGGSDVEGSGSAQEESLKPPSDPGEDPVARRKAWWERLKLLYCDAYFLMFEQGAVYYEDEQAVTLWRAQTLMFFFCLQALFEVAGEAQNGFERAIQAMCPPFAKLPLKPPKGMEGAGAVVRGIAERARLARDEPQDAPVRNLAVEAGEFQEKVRTSFETELYAHGEDLLRDFDKSKNGKVSLDEFVQGCQALSTRGMRLGGMPPQVLEAIIRDLAAEIFYHMDVDGSGEVSLGEVRAAVKQRRKEAQERLRRGSALGAAMAAVDALGNSVPGASARSEARRQHMEALRPDAGVLARAGV